MRINLPRRFYIYFPLLLFSVYFGIDKFCLFKNIKFLTQPDAVFLYFDHKMALIDEMEGIYKRINKSETPVSRNKIFLVLGSSRLLYFNYKQYSRNFPQWEIFNFSVPVASPAYFTFILERILERGIKPDYILIETDPYQYNAQSNVFRQSNLAHSFDFRFIVEHIFEFSADDISYFLARNMFAGYKYSPWPETLQKRFSNPGEQTLIWLKMLDKYQKENRGAGRSLIPLENWYDRDFPRLQKLAGRDIRRLYGHYEQSERQFQFLRDTLDLAFQNKIAVIMLRPQISRPMEQMIQADKKLLVKLTKWEESLEEIIKPFGYPYIDLARRSDFYCNTFVDASHMSLDCYHPMLILIMRQYQNIKAVFK